MKLNLHRQNTRLAVAVGMVAACFLVNIGFRAYAQEQSKQRAKEKEETFTRPKPTRPIKPEVPGANRYQEDKVFLEYADSLFKVESRDTVERQIVKGNVKFRQGGMWMFCDSAYYYPELNSLDAFGHVKMEQGDTLFVYADMLYYEGNQQLARLKNGPSQNKVKLINRDVTLTTDSLDYSIASEIGWYSRWGTIDDKVNNLTSLYGEYSPDTKVADFYTDVVLVNNKDGYTMLTDTLHYNTATHIAEIASKTKIQGANDTIITTQGIYNTEEGNAELLSRSMIIHKDSNNNVTTLEGDSIIYDKKTRISRAYMFSTPGKHAMPMVLTDTAHKTTLIGGFGLYNDSTREAFASMYPLLMEYSQGDTLFMRADTIKTFILTEMVRATRRWTKSGFPEKNGKPILTAKDGRIELDSAFFEVLIPLINKPLESLNKVAPQVKKDTAKSKDLPLPGRLDPKAELMKGIAGDKLIDPDNIQKNGDIPSVRSIKNSGSGLDRISDKGEIGDFESGINRDTVAGMNGSPEDSLKNITADTIPMVPKEFHVAQAFHRVRFFKQDIQGIADSILFVEKDSMMYMFRKPIVWSGERQVTGNRIDVHFNDSTADWALLPESGMLSELVDEDFFNQLAGKKLLATFADQTLKTLDVSGNVEMIFLPQESDSTYNRMIAAESSYLTLEMKDRKIDRLKMWPEVNGTVTPLFMVKRQQQFLRQFRWWESLRPVREKIGDRWQWVDDLGEVTEELDAYFLAPSDFGVPKSFPADRPAPVSTVHFPSLNAIEKNEQEMETEKNAVDKQSREIEEAVIEEESDEEKNSNEEKNSSEELESSVEEERL